MLRLGCSIPFFALAKTNSFLLCPAPRKNSIALIRFKLFGLRLQTLVGSARSARFGLSRFSILAFSRLNRTFFRFSPFSPRWLFGYFHPFPIPFRLRRRG